MSDWSGSTRRGERVAALATVAAVHVGVLLLVLLNPGDVTSMITDPAMKLINVRPPAPRPAPKPKPTPAKAAAPAPAKAKPVSKAPPLPVPIPSPPAPPTLDGSGAGAGEAGSGTGAAGTGSGTGASSPSLVRHAVWIGDDISSRDYPDAAKRAGLQGVVDLRFIVRVDGYVRNCEVIHSSGGPDLGRLTCALAGQRRLYDPARNVLGEPMEEVATRRFRFTLGQRRR